MLPEAPFLSVSAAIGDLFSTRELRYAFSPPNKVADGLPDFTLEDACARQWPNHRWAVAEHANALRAIADRKPPNDDSDPLTLAAVHMWSAAIKVTADGLFRHDRGRAGMTLFILVDSIETLQMVAETCDGRAWFSPDKRRGMIRNRLRVSPHDLHATFDLCVGGSETGWLNERERTASLQRLEGEQGPESREKVLRLWRNAQGNPDVFPAIWDTFALQVMRVVDRADRSPVVSDVREGVAGYRRFLSRFGITTDPNELHQAALKQLILCRQECARLSRKLGLPGQDISPSSLANTAMATELAAKFAPDNDALRKSFGAWDRDHHARCEQTGILPPRPLGVEVRYVKVPDGRLGACAPASVMPMSQIEDPLQPRVFEMRIKPFSDGADGAETQRAQALIGPLAAAHEGYHIDQLVLGPSVCPIEWRLSSLRNVSIEGSALLMETLSLEIEGNRDPLCWLVALRMAGMRLARFIVEYGYHVLGWSVQRAIEEYAALGGIPRAEAEQDIARMTFGVGNFSCYLFGLLGYNSLADRHFGGDMKRMMREVFRTSACYVPANVWAYAMGLEPAPDSLPLVPSSFYPIDAARRAIA